MLKYFSFSDLQYFWKKTDLYFIPMSIFWFPKFLSIGFVLHFNVQTTGSVLPSLGTTWNSCKFGHKMAPPAICRQICTSFQRTNDRVDSEAQCKVLNIIITWHYLNWLQIWLPGGATSISCKLALITSLHHLHCLIALNCPLGIISQYWVGIFISQSHIS